MSLQPDLEGSVVLLRPLVEADRLALTEAASDPAIWAQHPDPKRHEPDRFRQFFDDALTSGGALVISERETGEIIGTSRYHSLDKEAGCVEIGWTFLIRKHWGGPTNREVKDLMLRHAFGIVPRVVFRIGTGNLRSRRAVEKLGARLTEEVETARGPGVVYELDAAAFQELRTG